jgi:hypothetical protein
MHRLTAIGVLAASLLVSCKADSPANVASDIISAFGGTCSSHGKWSQMVQSQTQQLMQIFKNLKDADECKELGSTLATINSTAAQIHGLYGNKEFLEHRQTQEELQELTLAFSNTTNPELQTLLTTEIATKQAQLASQRAAQTLQNDNKERLGPNDQFSRSTLALGQSFATLFNNTASISQCLQQSPGSTLSLLSSLAGIAGSFVSPVLGGHAQVLTNALATFTQYMRHHKIDSAIWDLHEAKMPKALTCGLESMTQFYCQAEDTTEILRNKNENIRKPRAQGDGFWRGLDLLIRRLPTLNAWLMDIRAGVPAQNTDDAARMNRVREKNLSLDTTDTSVRAELNTAERLSNKSDDEDSREDIKLSYLSKIAISLSGANSHGMSQNNGSPFVDFNSSPHTYACILIKGVDYIKNCPTPDPGEDLRPYLVQKIPGGLESVSIADIRDLHWVSILTRVRRQVAVQFNEIIFVDPNTLIAQASERRAGVESPIQIIGRIREFLLDLQERSAESQPSRLPTIASTIKILDDVTKIVSEYNGETVDSLALLSLYEIFNLETGSQYISFRLGRLVEWDLQDHLANKQVPPNIADILIAANDEIVRRLTAAGYENTSELLLDLGSAKTQSLKNIQVFRSFMLEAAGRAVQMLDRDGREAGETLSHGSARDNGQQLAHLCLMLYSTGDGWPDQKTEALCKEATLFSYYPDPTNERKIVIRELMDRVAAIPDALARNRKRRCAFTHYLRAERLYETLSDDTRGFSSFSGHDARPLASHLDRDTRPLASHLDRDTRPLASHLDRDARPLASHLDRDARPLASHLDRDARPPQDAFNAESTSHAFDDRRIFVAPPLRPFNSAPPLRRFDKKLHDWLLN